jgi:DNA-binding transcriptional regulator YbjK
MSSLETNGGGAGSRPSRGEGREALLDALVRIASRDGLDAVTHRSVAAEAGVTHGLATYHFATLDDMVREALVWATRRAIERTGIGDIGETLDAFCASIPARIADDPENARFQYELAIEGTRRAELGEEVRRLYDQYIEAVRGVLAAHGAGDDPVLARLVFAAVDGLVLQQLVYGDAGQTEECVERLQALLALVANSR